MPARPTDRQPSSRLEKINARLNQTLNDSALLRPVSNGVNAVARKAIFQALKRVKFGGITVIEDYASQTQAYSFGSQAINSKSSSAIGRHFLHVTLTIHDISVYRQLLFGGSIALADSYINGEWDTDDLTGLIRLAARNLAVLNKLENRFAGISKAFEKANHQLRSNDQSGSKS
ncbi:MAG: SAM-dependent methyltransferase, partial [Psychrobacter sp.]